MILLHNLCQYIDCLSATSMRILWSAVFREDKQINPPPPLPLKKTPSNSTLSLFQWVTVSGGIVFSGYGDPSPAVSTQIPCYWSPAVGHQPSCPPHPVFGHGRSLLSIYLGFLQRTRPAVQSCVIFATEGHCCTYDQKGVFKSVYFENLESLTCKFR